MHIAASRGYANIVDMLLQHGAKVNVLDASDRTPLYLAVTRSNHKVADILIQQGAKVNLEEVHGEFRKIV